MKAKAVADNQRFETESEGDRVLVEEDNGSVRLEPLVLTVRRQYKKSGDLVIDPEEEVEEIAVQSFHVEPANVSLRVNHTLDLGHFWSLSVRVGLDVPCYREEHAAAMEFVARTVAERLVVEIEKGEARSAELRAGLRSGPSSGDDDDHPL